MCRQFCATLDATTCDGYNKLFVITAEVEKTAKRTDDVEEICQNQWRYAHTVQ